MGGHLLGDGRRRPCCPCSLASVGGQRGRTRERVVGGRGHGFAVAAGLAPPSHRHKERGGFKGIRRKGKKVMGVVSRGLKAVAATLMTFFPFHRMPVAWVARGAVGLRP